MSERPFLGVANIKSTRRRRVTMVLVAAPFIAIRVAPDFLRHLPYALGQSFSAFGREFRDCFDDDGSRLIGRAWRAMWAPDWHQERASA